MRAKLTFGALLGVSVALWLIPVSAQSEDGPAASCATCGGKRAIECPHCHGQYRDAKAVRVLCLVKDGVGCNATGVRQCFSCRGIGYTRCARCYGTGSITVYEEKAGQLLNGRPEVCPPCGGRGWVACEKCRKTGQITCPRCKGEGVYELKGGACPYCKAGRMLCPECAGGTALESIVKRDAGPAPKVLEMPGRVGAAGSPAGPEAGGRGGGGRAGSSGPAPTPQPGTKQNKANPPNPPPPPPPPVPGQGHRGGGRMG